MTDSGKKTQKGSHAKKRKKHAKKHAPASKPKEADITSNKSLFQNIKLWHVLAVVIVVLLIYMIAGRSPATSDATGTVADGDKVVVEFYVMSQCPYGTQVENAIAPVMESMGDAVDLRIDYIVSEVAPGNFQSLHGEPEVSGDIVQLCAKEVDPDNYFDFILCQNKNAGAIPDNWESCAKDADINTEELKACYEGDEGKDLLSASAVKAQQRNARGSPTIFIADQPYQGARDGLSFQRAICQFTDHSACDSIPVCASDADCVPKEGKVAVCLNPGKDDAVCEQQDAVKVELIVLNDEECSSCDTSQIVAVSKQLFVGAEPRDVDTSSAEGKQLIEDLGITVVPAYLFDASVKDSRGWANNPQAQGAFEKKGDYMKLRDEATGASYFVDDDARAEHYEAIGVTLGDNKPQIDFFVMSYCPYGNQAEELIEPVFDNLQDSVEFIPRYVIYSNYQGGGPKFCFDDASKYCSMHGIVELNQDIRESCVRRHVGTQAWFDFATEMNAKCDSQNADTCWVGVAEGLDLDTEVIETCFDDEALDILEENFVLNQKLGVTGSPTIFVDGDKYGGARDSASIQGALCAAFDDAPSACAKTLTGSAATAAAPAPAAGCGV